MYTASLLLFSVERVETERMEWVSWRRAPSIPVDSMQRHSHFSKTRPHQRPSQENRALYLGSELWAARDRRVCHADPSWACIECNISPHSPSSHMLVTTQCNIAPPTIWGNRTPWNEGSVCAAWTYIGGSSTKPSTAQGAESGYTPVPHLVRIPPFRQAAIIFRLAWRRQLGASQKLIKSWWLRNDDMRASRSILMYPLQHHLAVT